MDQSQLAHQPALAQIHPCLTKGKPGSIVLESTQSMRIGNGCTKTITSPACDRWRTWRRRVCLVGLVLHISASRNRSESPIDRCFPLFLFKQWRVRSYLRNCVGHGRIGVLPGYPLDGRLRFSHWRHHPRINKELDCACRRVPQPVQKSKR